MGDAIFYEPHTDDLVLSMVSETLTSDVVTTSTQPSRKTAAHPPTGLRDRATSPL